MKKVLLLVVLLLTIMVGCEDYKEKNIKNVESNILNASFEERTKEAVDFMNQDNGYGIPRS
jgi:hypothetical protein